MCIYAGSSSKLWPKGALWGDDVDFECTTAVVANGEMHVCTRLRWGSTKLRARNGRLSYQQVVEPQCNFSKYTLKSKC